FVSIKTATPKGITAQMVEGGPVIGITWDKLDLKALEADQKVIHEAYLRSVKGETVQLNLGPTSDAPKPVAAKPVPGAPPAAVRPAETAPESRYPGWLDTKAGGFSFMLQMPPKKARGILFLGLGEYGDSFGYLHNHERGSGRWGAFQNKHGLALMTYDLGNAGDDANAVPEFVFAQKGSGKALLSALDDFAVKSKQEDLKDLPIAFYGTQRVGAAFAYNFTQWMPDRVIATVASKGAFYDSEPSPASLRVPMLLIWGQYSNIPELWGSENSAKTVLAKYAAKNPNWTNGREFRGQGEQNAIVEHFGMEYLHEAIAMRLPKEDSKAADKPAAEAAEGVAAADSKPEASTAPKLIEIDRAKGSLGNLATREVLKISDPAAVQTEEETFLPNSDIGKMWKEFIAGEMQPPSPPVQ
ncbi:MAG: hypothetical protein ABL994_14405, partial [Verrucomicrobiales bacterium]